MSSTRKTPARSKAFTARSTLSVLAAAATPVPKSAPAPLLVSAAANDAAAAPAKAPARAPISREERHWMIAKVAYSYAERAGFGSDPVADWLMAEREIDSMLGLAS
jgi:hypothetical protein